jgi:hypothetical protein
MLAVVLSFYCIANFMLFSGKKEQAVDLWMRSGNFEEGIKLATAKCHNKLAQCYMYNCHIYITNLMVNMHILCISLC